MRIRLALLGLRLELLRLLGVDVSRTAPLPLQALTRAQQALSRRLISLRVTGTTRSPTMQLRPGRLLGQDAVRFFLSRRPIP